MASHAESTHHLTAAEEAFAEFLALQDRGEADFEAFCKQRPELTPGLRRLRERWHVFEEAVSADLSPEEVTATDASAERLLRGLRRDDAEDSRYEARDEIGRGGMGRVLKVWDRDLRRSLAMKVLQDGRRRDPRSLARFLDEALVTGQLEHPGIVPIYELGLDSDGNVYFTMPFVRGEDLQRIFERVRGGEPGWTRARAIGVLMRVCEAVGFAHARGVVHRDLKPSNVMVGPFGETYVMDWGLARILGRSASTGDPPSDPPAAGGVSQELRSVRRDAGVDSDPSPLSTMEGDVVGTPVYMAPEQAHGWIERVGPQTDVYSIGAMLYQLLTGSRPYLSPGEADSSEAVLRAVKSRAPRPVHTLADDVPPELEAICDKAMARDVDARYASTMELAGDLQAFLEHRVVGAYETGAGAELRKWVRRNRRLAVLGLVAAMSLVLGSTASAWFGFASRRSEKAALEEQNRADEASDRLVEELRVSKIEQGRLFARTRKIAKAEDLLWRAYLADRRDRLGRYALRELFRHQPLLGSTQLDREGIHVVVPSPDGWQLAAGSAGGAIHIVDSASLEPVEELDGHAAEVFGLAFHRDGRLLVSSSLDDTVAIWDLAGRRRVGAVGGDGTGFHSLALHPTKDLGAAGTVGGKVVVFDLPGGETVAMLDTGETFLRQVAFEPADGALLASSAEGGVWRWRDLDSPPELVVRQPGGIVGMALSPDGTRIATGGRLRVAHVWDAATGKELMRLKRPNGTVRGLAFHPDGRRLAVSGWYSIDIWDVEERAFLRSYAGESSGWEMRFLEGGRRMIAGINSGRLCAWSLDAPELYVLPDHEGRVVCDVLPDGRTFVTGDARGRVRFLALDDCREQRSLPPMPAGVEVLDVDPTGTRLAVRLQGGELRVYDVERGDLVFSQDDAPDPALWNGAGSLDFRPDGKAIAVARPESVDVIDATSAEVLVRLEHESVTSVSWSPDGSRIATSYYYDLITKVWTADGDLVTEIAHELDPIALHLDGAGRLLVSTWQFGTEVWDADTGRHLGSFADQVGEVWDFDVNPADPAVVVSCAGDGSVHLWDLDTMRSLLWLNTGTTLGLRQVRFFRDGRTVLLCGSDGFVGVWDLTFYDRHIAGNLRHQLERLGAAGPVAHDRVELERWADAVLADPWPRFAR